MRTSYLLLILVFVYTAGCKITKPAANVQPEVAQAPITKSNAASSGVDFSDPSTWLLGYFNPDRLKQMPYSAWFIKGYDDYSINSGALNKLLEIRSDNLKIKVVMGTWCPDSRREVPGFMRILDIWKFPVSN